MVLITAPADLTLRLDRALSAAVEAHWADLVRDSAGPGAVMEIGYGTAVDHSVNYVKVFSSEKRGYWNLVCEYWLKPLWSHSTGLSFVTGTHPAEFAAALTLILEHQESFVGMPYPDRSLQIFCPTSPERVAAHHVVAEIFRNFAPSPIGRDHSEPLTGPITAVTLRPAAL